MAEYVADKLDAARHSISGSNVSKAICKASSREILGPKKKHIDYLLECTHSDNISIPSLAELLFERSRMTNWVIVSKSLVTFHHLMSAGNERFLQYLASRTTLWNLEGFLDKSGVLGYDMSTFIRRYSMYLAKKTHTYTDAGYDYCRVTRGPDGLIRKQDTPKLLKALPQIQQQVDSLLEVDVQSSELGNSVINSAFVMLFKDLVKLFACYNDGMINLLEKYFEMNKKSCKEALEIYKKFLARMDSVKTFLKVAEERRLTDLMVSYGKMKDVGINPSDIPDLTKAPSSLIDALENHYQSLEKGKVPTSSAKRPNLEPITVPQLTTESLNNPITFNAEEYQKQELIKEENERLNAFKQTNVQREVLITAAPSRQHPSSRQDAWNTTFETNAQNNSEAKHNNNNDLLALHEVFATPKPVETFPPNNQFGQPQFGQPQFGQPQFAPPATGPSSNQAQAGFAPNQSNPWSPAANQTGPSHGEDLFASSSSFDQPFAGNVLNTGDILQPMNRPAQQQQQQQLYSTPTESGSKGDLRSSLNKVAMQIDNLNVSGIRPAPGSSGKSHQWTAPKPTVKTGGANFQMGTATGPTLPAVGIAQPVVPVASVRPAYGQPVMYGVPQPMVYGQPQAVVQPQTDLFPQQRVAAANDPFGAPIPGSRPLF